MAAKKKHSKVMALKNEMEISFIMVKKWSQLIEYYDTRNISIIAGTVPLGSIFTASTFTSWGPDEELRWKASQVNST